MKRETLCKITVSYKNSAFLEEWETPKKPMNPRTYTLKRGEPANPDLIMWVQYAQIDPRVKLTLHETGRHIENPREFFKALAEN